MFKGIISALRKTKDAAPQAARRNSSRRECDRCIGVVNEQPYPVKDWSLGGFLMSGDDRTFSVNQECEIMLKFHLRNRIIDIPHRARVVRKTHHKIAFEFMPLSSMVRKLFQTVVDDYVAGKFAQSQMG